jgi:hypothetical protein
VTVVGTVRDDHPPVQVSVDGKPATVTGEAWQVTFDSSRKGPTGSRLSPRTSSEPSPATRDVTLDLGPPQVVIDSPANPTLTSALAVTVSGRVRYRSPVTVQVNGIAADVARAGDDYSFTAPNVPLPVEGTNPIEAVATGAGPKPGRAEIQVVRDSTPPVIESLGAPPVLPAEERPVEARSRRAPGVAEVVLRVNGEVKGTFDAPPYIIQLTIPDSAEAGDVRGHG